MEQTDPNTYTAANGEVITISVTPIKAGGGTVTATTKGQPITNTGGDASPQFQFTINKGAGGLQFAEVLCNFPSLPGDPSDPTDEPSYKFRLTDTQGVTFQGPTVKKSDATHLVTFTFS